jgi:hypothetical protein
MLSCLPSTSSLFVRPRPAQQASGRVRFPLGYDYYPFTSISSSVCPLALPNWSWLMCVDDVWFKLLSFFFVLFFPPQHNSTLAQIWGNENI